LSQEEIAELEKQHAEKPEGRVAHKALAKAVTDLIHGSNATAEAMRASEILFGGGLEGISEETFKDIVGEVPTKEIARNKFEGDGISLIELLVEAGLTNSKGQARKDIEGGGININNMREGNVQRQVTTGDLLFGRFLLLRKGKRNYTAISSV
jgi:tyrosyl-tRNA synthetase